MTGQIRYEVSEEMREQICEAACQMENEIMLQCKVSRVVARQVVALQFSNFAVSLTQTLVDPDPKIILPGGTA